MSLRAQLRHWYREKYIIEIAESAEEGLELIEELIEDGKRIRAVISDWLMPGMKGDEFLIRVHQHFPELTKIMLTGHADPDAFHSTSSAFSVSLPVSSCRRCFSAPRSIGDAACPAWLTRGVTVTTSSVLC